VLRVAARELIREVPVARQRYEVAALPAHAERWSTAMERDPASVSLVDRVAVVDAEFERVNTEDPRVRSVRVGTDVGEGHRVFVDRTRRLVSATTNVNHGVFVFGFEKGKPGFGFARNTGQGGLELAKLSDEKLERM